MCLCICLGVKSFVSDVFKFLGFLVFVEIIVVLFISVVFILGLFFVGVEVLLLWGLDLIVVFDIGWWGFVFVWIGVFSLVFVRLLGKSILVWCLFNCFFVLVDIGFELVIIFVFIVICLDFFFIVWEGVDNSIEFVLVVVDLLGLESRVVDIGRGILLILDGLVLVCFGGGCCLFIFLKVGVLLVGYDFILLGDKLVDDMFVVVELDIGVVVFFWCVVRELVCICCWFIICWCIGL